MAEVAGDMFFYSLVLCLLSDGWLMDKHIDAVYGELTLSPVE
jgi:hypothetical protein